MREKINSASDGDMEKQEFLDVKNVKGKILSSNDNGKVHLESFMLFVHVNELKNVLGNFIIQENFNIKGEK